MYTRRPHKGLRCHQFNKVRLKSKEKFHLFIYFMITGQAAHEQPQTCSHLIYAWTPPGSQIFSSQLLFLCIHMHRIIGSDLLSQSTPNGTIWIFIYLWWYIGYKVNKAYKSVMPLTSTMQLCEIIATAMILSATTLVAQLAGF